MKFIQLINVKMPTIGILTFICRINDFFFFIYIFIDFGYFNIYEQDKFHDLFL